MTKQRVHLIVYYDILPASVCAIFASLVMHKCAPFSSGVLCPYSLMDYDIVYSSRIFHIPVSYPGVDIIRRQKKGSGHFSLIQNCVQIKCNCAFLCCIGPCQTLTAPAPVGVKHGSGAHELARQASRLAR